jgi:hypothetical protein
MKTVQEKGKVCDASGSVAARGLVNRWTRRASVKTKPEEECRIVVQFWQCTNKQR